MCITGGSTVAAFDRAPAMSDHACDIVRNAALWFEPEIDGFGSVLDRLGDARLVLMGEPTRGTEEFYRIRAELTRALITRKGFNLVAVEADWPDAYRANRYVRHESDDPSAVAALAGFTRFPQWIWRNVEVVRFLEWLREHNGSRGAHERCGFYGLDLYSLHSSMDAALHCLRTVDPEAARHARLCYSCFEAFGEDAQSNGYAAAFGLERAAEDAVVAALVESRRKAAESAHGANRGAADDSFVAEQNARLARNAESYYRAMFGGRVECWNQRDTHMMETLETLLRHITRLSGSARAVVWAHNSHLGDARATEMGQQHGEINLGQLARERYREEARLVGFTTHTGTVTAAGDWEEPGAHMRMHPAHPASYEALFHTAGLDRFALTFEDDCVCEALTTPRLERAIGLIYKPETERSSHYFTAELPRQFDVVLHIDRTQALQPLEVPARHEVELAKT